MRLLKKIDDRDAVRLELMETGRNRMKPRSSDYAIQNPAGLLDPRDLFRVHAEELGDNVDAHVRTPTITVEFPGNIGGLLSHLLIWSLSSIHGNF